MASGSVRTMAAVVQANGQLCLVRVALAQRLWLQERSGTVDVDHGVAGVVGHHELSAAGHANGVGGAAVVFGEVAGDFDAGQGGSGGEGDIDLSQSFGDGQHFEGEIGIGQGACDFRADYNALVVDRKVTRVVDAERNGHGEVIATFHAGGIGDCCAALQCAGVFTSGQARFQKPAAADGEQGARGENSTLSCAVEHVP